MYISATALMILGALLGTAGGVVLDYPVLKIIICGFAGGFAGSAAGAILFTFLYLTADDHGDDADEQPRPGPDPGGDKQLPRPAPPPGKGRRGEPVAVKQMGAEQNGRTVKNAVTGQGDPTVQKTGAGCSPPAADTTVIETDKMKIKRLEQEIRTIKNRSIKNKGRV